MNTNRDFIYFIKVWTIITFERSNKMPFLILHMIYPINIIIYYYLYECIYNYMVNINPGYSKYLNSIIIPTLRNISIYLSIIYIYIYMCVTTFTLNKSLLNLKIIQYYILVI